MALQYTLKRGNIKTVPQRDSDCPQGFVHAGMPTACSKEQRNREDTHVEPVLRHVAVVLAELSLVRTLAVTQPSALSAQELPRQCDARPLRVYLPPHSATGENNTSVWCVLTQWLDRAFSQPRDQLLSGGWWRGGRELVLRFLSLSAAASHYRAKM